MEKIFLLTENTSLKKEILPVLPKGFKLVKTRLVDASGRKGQLIIFDIDTFKAGLMKEFSERNFVIAVTSRKETGPVMDAATFGTYEVLHRPLQKENVSKMLQELHNLKTETKNAIEITKKPLIFAPTCAIVGHSPLIMNVCKKVAKVSQVDVPVLITGDTGTGKELIAEAIAQLSTRFGKSFEVINCAAIPENLLESELFGYEKGAFTGAISPKEGILKIADGGCIFFDEIGELPLSLQGKILRFLQTQTFYPLGSTKEIQVNVRVIAATNRDLLSMVKEGKFREDLYHRLHVAVIHIPPLCERKEDIIPLVHFFINRHRHIAPKPIKGMTRAFLQKLISYDWPGNIRELENTIRSAIAFSKTPYLTTHELKELGSYSIAIDEKGFSETLASAVIPFLKEAIVKKEKDIYKKIHGELDKHVFGYILSYTKENKSESARLLGIDRLTLRNKLM